jgi:hypothetical protein
MFTKRWHRSHRAKRNDEGISEIGKPELSGEGAQKKVPPNTAELDDQQERREMAEQVRVGELAVGDLPSELPVKPEELETAEPRSELPGSFHGHEVG